MFAYYSLLGTPGLDSKCVNTCSPWHSCIFEFYRSTGSDSALHGPCRFAYALLFWSCSFTQAPRMMPSIGQPSPKTMETKQEPACTSVAILVAGPDWEQNGWQLEHSKFRSVASSPGLPPNQRTYLDRIGEKQGEQDGTLRAYGKDICLENIFVCIVMGIFSVWFRAHTPAEAFEIN